VAIYIPYGPGAIIFLIFTRSGQVWIAIYFFFQTKVGIWFHVYFQFQFLNYTLHKKSSIWFHLGSSSSFTFEQKFGNRFSVPNISKITVSEQVRFCTVSVFTDDSGISHINQKPWGNGKHKSRRKSLSTRGHRSCKNARHLLTCFQDVAKLCKYQKQTLDFQTALPSKTSRFIWRALKG